MSQYLSKKELVRELVKCGKDPAYFIDNYCKIAHPQRGQIPFKTWDFQRDLLQKFNDYRNNVILKSRQMGISTVTAAYVSWMMLFHRDKNILVIATKFSTAANLVKKVKAMIKLLPPWFDQIAKIAIDNRSSFVLSNGSEIKASSTSADAGRSEALSLLVIDEAAHIDGFGDLWTALQPTMAAGGRCIALSSPNGVGNWFHKTYVSAQAGENDFHPTILHWTLHPERDQVWFDETTRNLSRRKVAQEYECFTAGSRVITNQGFTHINKISVGDLVLTHSGAFQKVLKTFKKRVEASDLLEISLPYSRQNKLVCTKNHSFRCGTTKNKKNILKNVEDATLERDWKTSQQLMECSDHRGNTSYLVNLLPKIRTSSLDFNPSDNVIDLSHSPLCKEVVEEHFVRYHRQKGKSSKVVEIDYNLGRVIGLFLSEGNYINNEKAVQFSFHNKEQDLIDCIVSFADTYGFRHHFDVREKSKCTVVYIANQFLKEIISKFVKGKYCYDKELILPDVMSESVEFIKGILVGIWEGDGLHSPKEKNVLVLANEVLIYQIRTLMAFSGVISRVSCKHYQKQYKKQFLLEVNSIGSRHIKEVLADGIERKPGCRSIQLSDGFWGRIKIDEYTGCEKEVDVYNLEVAHDNSYVVENLVVHNCNFNASGETVIHPDNLNKMEQACCKPEHQTGFDRNFWIWDRYNTDNKYLLVGDVSRGDGADYSVFHIFNTSTMVQVAEYRGKPTTDLFAKILFDAGEEYGNAMLVVENNNIGFSVLEKLIDAGYPNLYYSTKGTHQYVEQYEAEQISNSVPGFTTSQKTRPLIVAKLEEFVRNELITINSERTYQELKTFVWRNGRPEAQRSYNDDLVMALAIACWIRGTVLQENTRDLHLKRATLNAMIVSNTKLNTTIPGMTGYKNVESSDRMQEAKKLYEDFGWIIKG